MKEIRFDDGSTVEVPENATELTDVYVTDRRGVRRKALWGSVIAQTNGEALIKFLTNQRDV